MKKSHIWHTKVRFIARLKLSSTSFLPPPLPIFFVNFHQVERRPSFQQIDFRHIYRTRRRKRPGTPGKSLPLIPYIIFSQQGYSSTKYSVSKGIPVQNIKSVGIFQYKYSVSKGIPVQNIQSVGIFQYKYSVSKDISVQNIQTVGIILVQILSQQEYSIFQYKIFSQ
jgi:hypothetical protein